MASQLPVSSREVFSNKFLEREESMITRAFCLNVHSTIQESYLRETKITNMEHHHTGELPVAVDLPQKYWIHKIITLFQP